MRCWFLLILVMQLSTVYAKDKFFPEPREIISVTQVDSALIQELIGGVHSDLTVSLQPGTEVPLRFFHRESFFSVAFNPNLSIKVEKPCYLRFMKRKVYISEDLVKWKKPRLLTGKTTRNVTLDQSGVSIESVTVEWDEDLE